MKEVTHIGLSLLGYNRNQVERILEQSETKVNTLEQKLAAVTEELEKVKQDLTKYIEMEQTLKDVMIDARSMGNKIKEESSEEAKRLADRTNKQVNQFKTEFSTYSFDLITNGEQLKKQMQTMREEMLTMLDRYQKLVLEMDFDAIYPEKEALRFNNKVETFVSEDDSIKIQSEHYYETTMTEEEKATLEQLISEVIAPEQQTRIENEQKLVPFVPKKKQIKVQA